MPLACETNLKLLEASLYYAIGQIKYRTTIINNDKYIDKWGIHIISRQYKNLNDMITAMSSYKLPYDMNTKKEIAVTNLYL